MHDIIATLLNLKDLTTTVCIAGEEKGWNVDSGPPPIER